MKKFLAAIIALCSSVITLAQDSGIRFENGLSWQQVLAKAKTENKYIFVDCYTTWCGPCKYMAKNIFPLSETGNAMNAHFISVGMQLDTTAKDAEAIRSEYANAHMIATAYQVRVYPTYLFFNPEGKLVHRAVGSTDAAHFIGITEDARNPDRQYYTMIEKYYGGNRDSVMLETLLKTAVYGNSAGFADSLSAAWLGVIKDPFTQERLELIAMTTGTTGSPGFKVFMQNAEKIDQVVMPDFAEQTITRIIARNNEQINLLMRNPSAKPDWDKIEKDIRTGYGKDYARRVIATSKLSYYKSRKDWSLYGTSVVEYAREYGKNMHNPLLNNYAWDIFQYCDKPDELAFGLTLSERSIAETPDPGYLDTYANLLYKSGKKSEAIAKETEAMNQANAADRPAFQETIDKMKSGAKTW